MIFNRTYHLHSHLSISEIKKRLLHQHVEVHGMDFEVSEKKRILKIIPHAENVDRIQTLPITHIDIKDKGGGGVKVKLFSKPRRIDAGGPYMVVIFCIFCIIGAGLFYWLNKTGSALPSIVMVGVALLIFIILWFRMETGYFDYVRKIKQFVHSKITASE